MKKTILLIVLSMLLLCAMAVPALAQYDWDVGIAVGDWFLYEGTLLFYDSATVPFPPPYLEYLQVYAESDWMNYTVIDITPGDGGDNVTFSVLTHWSNGTETTSELVDNMTSSMTLMVIGANLADYTEIRPEYDILGWPMPARYLNESFMLDTDNGTRETNVLDHDSDIFTNIYHYIYYWDKETGIQVYFENYATDVVTEEGQPYSYKCKLDLVNSSSGVIVPDLTGPVMLSAFIAITVPIVLYKRKKLLI